MRVSGNYLRWFLAAVCVVGAFELLFFLHAFIDAYKFDNIDAFGVFTIWAAVLTVVFLVFAVMGLLNIDNRIKELNDARDRLSVMETEMRSEINNFKLSAEEERRKIVSKARQEVIELMNESTKRQNTFDRLTQIACTPDPMARIAQYTEVLKEKNEKDGVNIGFIYCKRAEAYQEMQRDAEALRDFERAIELIPQEVDPYLGIGCFYVHRKKDYARSIEYFEKAVKIKPTLGVGYSNIANSYAAMGEYEKANEYYQRADDCGVESAEWFYNKALTISRSGESDPELKIQESYYRRCLSLEPLFFRAAINLAMVYRERNEDGRAEQILSELISRSSYRPEFVNSVIQRGICTMKMNRFAEAYNDFAFAYVFAPKNTQVLCNLAHCALRLLRLNEADEFASVCIEYAKIEGKQDIVQECQDILTALANMKQTLK